MGNKEGLFTLRIIKIYLFQDAISIKIKLYKGEQSILLMTKLVTLIFILLIQILNNKYPVLMDLPSIFTNASAKYVFFKIFNL